VTVARRGPLVVAALLACWLALPGQAEAQPAEPPSIVLVLTDDQRWDTLGAMPTVQRELVAKGVTFTNAFATNPLCCPSRASILTGRYSHSTGVYNNAGQHGGWARFRDDEGSTVATWLRSAGYRTGFFGKYLNNYSGTFVPPGWTHWVAFSPVNYYDYGLNVNGAMEWHGRAPDDYSTDVLADAAVSFVRGAAPGPLLVVLAPFAPHGPSTPAVRHEGTFSGLAPWRPPGYNEADVSDKPAWLRGYAPLTVSEQANLDNVRRHQLESLLAVDDAVGALLSALDDTGRLGNAMIVFTSDNGLLWGEHRWTSKVVPYEESIRVPLVVRFDPLARGPTRSGRLVTNVDLAPTFAQIAGVGAPRAEGRSILGPLSAPESPWRRDFLLESRNGPPNPLVPSYCALRTPVYSYVQYGTGEEELYDLRTDPSQLGNLARAPAQRPRIASFRLRLRALCNPPPPGFEPRSACHLIGSKRRERLRGTPYHDRICAGSGGDRIYGRGTGDTVLAGHGNDLVQGGPGPDIVYSGLGRDRLSGNSGNDTIYAADGRPDVIRCGPGFDTVQVDRRDRVSLCERVRRLGR
jgi:N-acetylglucosamine-6-sulfatase